MLNDRVPGGSPLRGRGSSRDSASADEAAMSPRLRGAAEPRVHSRTRDALPVLQTGLTGHSGHLGFRATHTNAPSSIIAWLNLQARLPFVGISVRVSSQIWRD